MGDWTPWLALLFMPAVLIVLAVHEMGHLLAARALGVLPLEFGIGIPPRGFSYYTGHMVVPVADGATGESAEPGDAIWINVREEHGGGLLATCWGPRKKKHTPTKAGETTITGRLRSISADTLVVAPMQWSLGLIPIGAFVRVAEGSKGPLALESASAWRQTVILGAGIVANLFLPVFALSAATVTASVNDGIVMSDTVPGSAAWQAGIRPGERIIRIGDQRVTRVRHGTEATRKAREGGLIEVTVRGADGDRTVELRPADNDGDPGLALRNGLSPGQAVGQIGRVPVKAAHNTVHMYQVIGEEINRWFNEPGGPELVSPIGAARETGQVVEQGRVTGWLIVVALFSANVGIANLLPVMPLDGGRLAMVGLRAACRGHTVNRHFEAAINYGGMAALVSITITLLIKDIATMLGA